MLGQAWPKKIVALQRPQDGARYFPLLLQRICSGKASDPHGDAGGETRRGGAIFLVGAAAVDFMQRAERQSAARQDAIDRLDSERQYPMPQRAGPLDPADAVLQGDKRGGR
jgi:hypothetical protein